MRLAVIQGSCRILPSFNVATRCHHVHSARPAQVSTGVPDDSRKVVAQLRVIRPEWELKVPWMSCRGYCVLKWRAARSTSIDRVARSDTNAI